MTFRKKMFAVTAFLAWWFAQTNAHAQGNAAPTVVQDNIGGRTIKFAVRPGECALEKSNPSDKRVLDQTQALIVNSNTLHVMSVDCKELAEWRSGRVKFLGDGMQIQSLKAAAAQDLTGQAKQIVTQVCDQFRSSAGDLTNQAETEVKKRIDETNASVRLESLKLLGVMNQDENACYVAARVAGKAENGQDLVKMMIFGTMILEGKLIYMYRFSNRQDALVLKDLMAELADDIRRQYAANVK